MIISVDAEIASDKIQHPFLIKTFNNLGIQGTYFNIIKAVYDNSTTNIILSGERSMIWNKTEVLSLSPLLLNIVLEVLASMISYKKK